MISVTWLSSYMYCPRKLFLEQVMKVIKPPKEVIVKGSIRHSFHDQVNCAEEGLVRSVDAQDGQDVLYERYRKSSYLLLKKALLMHRRELEAVGLSLNDAFRSMWRFVLLDAAQRAENLFEFKQRSGMHGDALWQALTPKIRSEMRVESSTLGLKGIVDQVENHAEGKIIPVELKSGSAPAEGVWPGHRVQIGAYMLLLEEKNPGQATAGKVKYLDAGSSRDVYLNPFLRDEILSVKEKVASLLVTTDTPPLVREKNKCVACELRERCYGFIKE